MAVISSSTIGGEAKFAPDYIFNVAALPNATNATSADAKEFGKSQSALELVIEADTDIVIADTKVLTFELLTDSDPAGSFTTAKTLYTVTASGETTIDAGTIIARYVSDKDTLHYAKVKVTTDDNLAAYDVSAYFRYISR